MSSCKAAMHNMQHTPSLPQTKFKVRTCMEPQYGRIYRCAP